MMIMFVKDMIGEAARGRPEGTLLTCCDSNVRDATSQPRVLVAEGNKTYQVIHPVLTFGLLALVLFFGAWPELDPAEVSGEGDSVEDMGLAGIVVRGRVSAVVVEDVLARRRRRWVSKEPPWKLFDLCETDRPRSS